MKRSHIYQTKIIYYISVKEFCLYPISKIEVDSTRIKMMKRDRNNEAVVAEAELFI